MDMVDNEFHSRISSGRDSLNSRRTRSKRPIYIPSNALVSHIFFTRLKKARFAFVKSRSVRKRNSNQPFTARDDDSMDRRQ